MKKILSVSLLSLAALFSQSVFAQKVSLEVPNEKNQMIELSVPFNPERIVALNYSTIDILDKLGLGSRIIAMPKGGSVPEHLKKYNDDPAITNIGTMKNIDMEKLMSLQPDIIFSSDRSIKNYKRLSVIAPTVASYVNYKEGFLNGFKYNLEQHAKIFGKEEKAKEQLAQIENRINQLKGKAEGKSAILGLFTGGSLKVLGDKGRLSLITNDIGFTNLSSKVNVNHGNNASYELLVKENPDYLFILDKDAAVGANATSAMQLLDNALIKQMDAHKNNNIEFLNPGSAWYLADGGLTSMHIMLENVERAFN